jgi:hypothetical protein
MLKALIATAALSLAMLVLPLGTYGPITTHGLAGYSPAFAAAKKKKSDIDIDIQIGDDDDDDDDDDRRRISCHRGKRIVERAGFRRVRPRDCNGRVYRYIARKRGDTFVIGVHSRRGRIVFVREID